MNNPRIIVYVNDSKNIMQGYSTSIKLDKKDKVAFVKIALFDGPKIEKYKDLLIKLRDDIDSIDLDVLTDHEDLQ